MSHVMHSVILAECHFPANPMRPTADFNWTAVSWVKPKILTTA
jgi:hypothetical protein